MFNKTLLLLSTVLVAATFAQAQQRTVTPLEETRTEKNQVQTAPEPTKQTASSETVEQPSSQADKQAASVSTEQTRSETVAADPQSPNTSMQRYRLQPSDVLNVNYRYTPEYNNEKIVVQPDGYISLELVGNVRVAGLTLEQAREKIKALAAERLRDPEVTIVLQDFVKPYFVVSGEVPVPGRFDLRDNTSALQAVLLAGGFKETSRSGQVLLLRRHNAEVVEVIEIKLNDLGKGSKLREDALLQSGDMIYVPRNRISKVERFLKVANTAAVFGFIF